MADCMQLNIVITYQYNYFIWIVHNYFIVCNAKFKQTAVIKVLYGYWIPEIIVTIGLIQLLLQEK